ncbi:hypothetical protein FKM82_014700 [Ascaphus truei]
MDSVLDGFEAINFQVPNVAPCLQTNIQGYRKRGGSLWSILRIRDSLQRSL